MNEIISVLYPELITAYEFAEILAGLDNEKRNTEFFAQRIWNDVLTGNLIPLPIQHTMGNPKFKPEILTQWAESKGHYKREEADISSIPSKQSDAELIEEEATSSPELLKKYQKKIGSNGGKKPKAKEALALLAINELRNERRFTNFMKMLNEHSSTAPYDGIDECSVIYLDGNRMCYTENKNNKSIETSIAVASMRRYFTNANKNK